MKPGKRQVAALIPLACLPVAALPQSARDIRQRTLLIGVLSGPADFPRGWFNPRRSPVN